MDVESLKQDVVSGKVDVDRLIGLIDKLSKKLDAANQRIEELEKQLAGPTTKLDEAFSVESEEKRQEARGKKSKRTRPRTHATQSRGRPRRTAYE
jgi:predicted  nucleic acid-binding Zn-ribbon protein